MPDISMLDLRANLTDVLRRVENGETFTVSRFGSAVATIGPVTHDAFFAASGESEVQATPTDASHPSKRPAPKNEPKR